MCGKLLLLGLEPLKKKKRQQDMRRIRLIIRDEDMAAALRR